MTAPVATPTSNTQFVEAGGDVAASSFFSVNDADGDAITLYHFFDGGNPGNRAGHFSVNGVEQPQQTIFEVSAAQLPNVRYVAGQLGWTETLWAQVYDGTMWSEWVSWSEIGHRTNDALPVVGGQAVKNVDQGVYYRLSDFVSATDADGDPIQTFYFEDKNTAAGSAQLWFNGALHDQGAIGTAGDLSMVWIRGGSSLGHDTIEVMASDGQGYGAVTSIDINTRLPNHAPVATPTNSRQTVVTGNQVDASTLFGVTDADADAMTAYHFYDSGAAGTSGHFSVNGVTKASQTIIDVAASDFAVTRYVAGSAPGSETLYMQVYDGTAWSEWTSWTEATLRASNALPVVAGQSVKNVLQNEWHQLAEFVNVTDADGDPILQFEVKDDNAPAGSAVLWANGALQAQGVDVVVNAADLTATWVRGGANLGTDTLEVRANDGYGWSDWTSFTLNTRLPNHAPVATPTASRQTVVTGNQVDASTLFGVTDADSDAMTAYHFYDSGAAGTSGHFTVNGVTKASQTIIDVAASDFAVTRYVAGSAPGSETLYVQVYDGTAWSEWTSWTEQTLRASNALPVVAGQAVKNVEQNQYVSFADFLNVTDADGDPILQFEIKDDNAAAGSGGMWLNGALQAQGADVIVNAADLTSSWARGGANLGTDTLEVRANDGYGWGAWKTFDLNTRLPNHAPVATPTAGRQTVVTGNSVAAASLFGVTDVEGDAITKYRFHDQGLGGGKFQLSLLDKPAQVTFEIDAADLGNVQYVAGSAPGTETLYMQVYDGTDWSAWTSWTEATLRASNVLPVVAGQAVKNVEQNQYVSFADFLNVTDADGDPILQFEIKDDNAAAGSGGMWLNGALQAQGADVIVNAADLTSSWARGGANLGTDTLEVRANDGYGWGAWKTFDLTTRLPNRVPVVTPTSATQTVMQGNQVDASTLFGVTDADGDAMTAYHFYDSGAAGTSGHFTVNGVTKASQTIIDVAASDLAVTRYVAGSAGGSETLYVQVYDGTAWSPWVSWTEQTLHLTNVAPVVAGPASRTVETNQYARLSDFLSVTDADGDPMVKFEIKDDDASVSSGGMWLNGALQAQGADVVVNASDLTTSWVRGGGVTGTNTFEVRAQDNQGAWSAWKSFDSITMRPAGARQLTEHVGLRLQNDSMGVTGTNDVYFGLGGDDHLDVQGFNSEALLMGGRGDDSYSANLSSTTVVYENGNSTNDSLQLLVNFELGAALIDGRHLVLDSISPSDDTIVILVDWQAAANRIEHFDFGAGGTYDFNALAALASSSGLQTITWESLGKSSAQMNEMISYYAAREAVLGFNRAPVVTGLPRNIGMNETVHLGSVFSVNDADGDLIQKYEITGLGTPHGTIYYQGNLQSFNTPIVVQGDFLLGQLDYSAPTRGTSDTFRVRAFDGSDWSNPVDVTLTVTNRLPVVSGTANRHIAYATESAITTFFSAADADGDAITQYEFTDVGTVADTGALLVNGVAQTAGSPLVVSSANLGTVQYRAGHADTLSVRAFDGFDWSAPFQVTVNATNQAPVATVNTSLLTVRNGRERSADTFLSASDLDSDPVFLWEFTRPSSSPGVLKVNGVVQAADTPIAVSQANLSQVTYLPQGSASATVDDPGFTVRAFDGLDWGPSTNAPFHVLPNAIPSVGAPDVMLYAASTAGGTSQRPLLNTMASVVDPDGNSNFYTFEITDNGSGGGHLVLNNVVQGANVPITVTSQQFYSSLSFLGLYYEAGGSGSETLSIRVQDDNFVWSPMRTFTVTNVLNSPPAVSASNFSGDPATQISMDHLFSASDANGQAITQVEIKYPPGYPVAGYTGGAIGDGFWTSTSNSFTDLLLLTGNYAGDIAIQGRAFDGVDWGNWQDATLTVTAGLPADGAGSFFDGTSRQIDLTPTPQTFHDWIGKLDNFNLRDSDDGYRFTLVSDSTLSVQINGFTGDQQVLAQLRTVVNGALNVIPPNATAFMANGGGSFLNPETIDTSFSIAAGTYYLSLNASGATTNTNYDLTIAAS